MSGRLSNWWPTAAGYMLAGDQYVGGVLIQMTRVVTLPGFR